MKCGKSPLPQEKVCYYSEDATISEGGDINE